MLYKIWELRNVPVLNKNISSRHCPPSHHHSRENKSSRMKPLLYLGSINIYSGNCGFILVATIYSEFGFVIF